MLDDTTRAICEFKTQIGLEEKDKANPNKNRIEKGNPNKKRGKGLQRFLNDRKSKFDLWVQNEKAFVKANPTAEMYHAKSFSTQSGLEGVSMMKSSLDVKEQNVSMTDQVSAPVYKVDSEMDSTRMLQDSSDADLGNFFQRPIKIREYEWSTSTTLADSFNPWTDFCTNPRVINRLTNFNLLRMKLHLKVMINGNGFQYGRAVLAYNPLDTFDDLSTHSGLVSADLVQTTQLPHVYLDPTTSQGGELILPFLYHKNYLNIPDGDWDEMGQCYLRSLNTLKHANGASDVVTITVLAWAEDVSLNVLTSVDASLLTPQSGVEKAGEEVDEANRTGMISGPASTISKVAKSLSGISMIAPYAMATAKAADVVGGVAKMFGYCAPAVTKAPDPYRPTATGSLANTNVPQPVMKLSVDNKQELTIDPRIAGLSGDDPLNIRDIASREAYVTKFNWNIGTAPETLLFNTRVTPVTWAETGLTPNSYLFPPCAVAALPFKYWTGSMKFRFQIVCSSFHKGRLKFVYDPNHFESVEYNTNYMRIVDISKEQDFTLTIGNGQEFTLLDHANPGPDSVTEIYSTTNYTGNAPGNGTLSVYVLNELTTPNSTVNNDIEINVFVSAGEDFEVFVPDSLNFQNFVFFPQSGVESNVQVPESMATTEPSAPQQMSSIAMGPGEQDLTDINKVFIGESIASFREILKRSNLHESQFMRASRGVNTGIRCMFPYLRGSAPDAVHVTTAAAGYNYVNTVLLHWIRYAFQGHRGSIRYKLLPRTYGSGVDNVIINAQRNPIGIGAEYTQGNSLNDAFIGTFTTAYRSVNSTTSLTSLFFPGTGVDGSAYTLNNVNPVTELEIPWYSPFRFSPGKEASYTGIEIFDPTWRFMVSTQANNASALDLWVSTGEDFQVYMWTGLPRMYYEAAPPLPL